MCCIVHVVYLGMLTITLLFIYADVYLIAISVCWCLPHCLFMYADVCSWVTTPCYQDLHYCHQVLTVLFSRQTCSQPTFSCVLLDFQLIFTCFLADLLQLTWLSDSITAAAHAHCGLSILRSMLLFLTSTKTSLSSTATLQNNRGSVSKYLISVPRQAPDWQAAAACRPLTS